jgi:hypothetical protein
MDAPNTTMAEWLQIVRGEYLEIPGLNLTKKQFQRLWNLDPPMCDALLDALVAGRFLRVTPNGCYARGDITQ